VVIDARRDDDVRFLPFALVARALERSAATAFGAKALVPFDGSPDELVTEIRRMLLREQEQAALVHQLDGEIGDLRVGDILETLARGKRDAIVRVTAGASRGAIRVRRGNVIGATFDSETARAALSAILSLRAGRFRVELRTVDDTDELGALDVETARAVLEQVERPREVSRAEPPSEDAPVAALAAAMMNAVSAYARRFLGETIVARELESAQHEAARLAPSLIGFRVMAGGMVSVQRIESAVTGGGYAIGLWIARALERLEQLRPGRFGVQRVDEVLGGLARLIDQVGFRSDFDAALGRIG
jgi:hypothetical protein